MKKLLAFLAPVAVALSFAAPAQAITNERCHSTLSGSDGSNEYAQGRDWANYWAGQPLYVSHRTFHNYGSTVNVSVVHNYYGWGGAAMYTLYSCSTASGVYRDSFNGGGRM